MNEEYLWDKSGEPDPEIQHLETLLAPLGHRPGKVPRFVSPARRRIAGALAIAAALAIVAGGLWVAFERTRPAWDVATLEGLPSMTRLGKGQSLSTDANSRARLNLEGVGEVRVEPNSKVSVLAIKENEQRLSLEHGTIHALIWAPPGRFIVDTPSAQTVDLGCEYTLSQDQNGVGLVRVSVGWVAFENDGRESFIPAGAACVTRPGKGPGIPYYEDTSSALVESLNRFDTTADARSVPDILSAARTHDAISLWHLLRRVAPADRAAVYDRLAESIKIPADVTRAGVLAGDPKMIDSIWNTLDLGDTSWWRMWKSRTPK